MGSCLQSLVRRLQRHCPPTSSLDPEQRVHTCVSHSNSWDWRFCISHSLGKEMPDRAGGRSTPTKMDKLKESVKTKPFFTPKFGQAAFWRTMGEAGHPGSNGLPRLQEEDSRHRRPTPIHVRKCRAQSWRFGAGVSASYLSSWLENWWATLSEPSICPAGVIYSEQEGILDSPGAKEKALVTLGCLQA